MFKVSHYAIIALCAVVLAIAAIAMLTPTACGEGYTYGQEGQW